MSVKVMDRVWDYSKSKGAARLVLLALADWAGDDGYCYPGIGAIVRKTQLTKPGVIQIIKRLQELGELQVTVRGHAEPDPVKERTDRPGGWQPTNYYRVTVAEVGNDVIRPKKRTRRKAVNAVDEVNGISKVVNAVGEGGKPGTLPYKEEPSCDPSSDPSERRAVDPVEDFRLAWNESTTSPISPVQTLTPRRRRAIRACLTERPIEAWRDIFARIERSSFCRGSKGWVATFDWLIGKADSAVKVLEGQYDDHFSPAELHRAREIRQRVTSGRCPHTPACSYDDDCLERIAQRQRDQRRAS